MRAGIFAAVALAVSAQTGVQPFAGTWTAARDGKTLVRLELRESGGAITGQISLGSVHLDKDGVVDDVIALPRNVTPIFDVALKDGVLSFARKDEDETDRFELRLVGDVVELRFLITPALAEELARDGIAIPKPIGLTRSPR